MKPQQVSPNLKAVLTEGTVLYLYVPPSAALTGEGIIQTLEAGSTIITLGTNLSLANKQALRLDREGA